MATPSGISAQFGLANESTYGTGVTPTRFHEINKENIKLVRTQMESKSLRSGNRVLRQDRQAVNRKGAAGSVELEVQSNGFGLLMNHMFGAAAITTPAGATLTRKIRSVLTDPTGLFFTAQVGRPDVSGVIQPFTYLGCKVASWELACQVDDKLIATVNIDGRDETTATGLAAASYPTTSELLYFTGAQIALGGTYSFPASVDTVTAPALVDVKGFSLKGDNKLATDRYFLRTSSLKKEPVPNDFYDINGSIDVEFNGLTDYTRFSGGVPCVLRAQFVGSLIEGAFNRMVEIILTAVRFDGETPDVAGPDILNHTLPFSVLNDTVNPPLIVNYFTTDVAV